MLINRVANMSHSMYEYFSIISDRRQPGKIEHPLVDIIILCICGVVSGADGWSDIEEFGKTHKNWLQSKGLLPNGIPVDDTIARVMSSLNPKEFQSSFIRWMNNLTEVTQGEVIAIDGKTLRHSFDKKSRKSAIHMVSAFASGNGVVLGQIKTEEKSNEITAIPALLDLLDIKGSIITIDAMGCQKKITKKVIAAGADYVIAVKGNQKTLFEDIKYFFNTAETNNFKHITYDYYEEIDKGHGRIEIRRYWITNHLECLAAPKSWTGLQSIGVAENETIRDGKTTIDRRYFIVSFSADAGVFANAVRRHWSIENSLHWVLDMSFREDECRIRKNHGAEIFSVVRHLALNLLKEEKSHQRGIKGKRYKAALDIAYAEKVLSPLF